jgi:hypothetical protein
MADFSWRFDPMSGKRTSHAVTNHGTFACGTRPYVGNGLTLPKESDGAVTVPGYRDRIVSPGPRCTRCTAVVFAAGAADPRT